MHPFISYILSDSYLRTLGRPLIVSAFIFVLSFFLGSATAVFLPQQLDLVMSSLNAFVEPLAAISPFGLFLFILFNNATKLFAVMIAGVGVGLMPLATLLANGYVVGIVGTDVAMVHGLDFVLAGTIPHGIIEFSALFLSTAVGFRLGLWGIARLRMRTTTNFTVELTHALTFFLYVIFPLVVLAAFIEAFFTPLLISMVARG